MTMRRFVPILCVLFMGTACGGSDEPVTRAREVSPVAPVAVPTYCAPPLTSKKTAPPKKTVEPGVATHPGGIPEGV